MSRKVIKYFFELAFIFVIPLLIICLNCNYSNTIEYDNNGNYQATEKHIEFTPPFSYYVNNKLYLNTLHFNQLASWTYTITNDESQPMVLYIDNSGTRKNHKFYVKSNFPDIQIWGSDDTFQNYWSGLPTDRQFYANTNSFSTLPYNYMFIRNYPTTDYLTNYGEIELYIEVFDLTEMFGSGYEPSTTDELSNYIDLNSYIPYTQDEAIYYESNDIVSSVYRDNYTIWGRIKYSFIQGLQLQDNFVLDVVISYTILWFTMFLIWHIIYLLFDKLFHLRRE